MEYYGANVILKSIAQVSTPDGSTILVQPFDKSRLLHTLLCGLCLPVICGFHLTV